MFLAGMLVYVELTSSRNAGSPVDSVYPRDSCSHLQST